MESVGNPAMEDSASASDASMSLYAKIVIGFILVLVILVSIFGNLLICVAIASDRRLRRLGNLFIVSLAIADLCVAALVMTFALANDLLDYWPFGSTLCDLWISFDINCSTCSIINLCAIALDRFMHIKYPMRYNRWMSKRIAIACVSIIWMVSCLISFLPISLSWHRPVPPEPTVHANNTQPHASRMTQSILESLTTNESTQQVLGDGKHRRHFPSVVLHHYQALYQNQANAHSSAIEQSHFVQLPLDEWPQCSLDLTPTYAIVSSTISFYLPCIIMLCLYAKLYAICQQHVKCIKSMTKPYVPSQQVPSQMDHSFMDQQSDHFPNSPSNHLKVKKSVSITASVQGSTSAPVVSTYSTSHQQSHVTEHKAAITLGIIMGTFLVCWMPFFCINIVAAYCKTCISSSMFKILTWLGYFNSCLNPAIYSIFNTEFRDAFRRILVRYLFNGDVSACSELLACNKRASATSRTHSGTMIDHNVRVDSGSGGGPDNSGSNIHKNLFEIATSSKHVHNDRDDDDGPGSSDGNKLSPSSSIMVDVVCVTEGAPVEAKAPPTLDSVNNVPPTTNIDTKTRPDASGSDQCPVQTNQLAATPATLGVRNEQCDKVNQFSIYPLRSSNDDGENCVGNPAHNTIDRPIDSGETISGKPMNGQSRQLTSYRLDHEHRRQYSLDSGSSSRHCNDVANQRKVFKANKFNSFDLANESQKTKSVAKKLHKVSEI